MPDIDKYDGTGCPKTHLQLFFSNVGSMRLTQKQMAKIFPNTLSGAVGRWFLSFLLTLEKNRFLKEKND